MGDTVRLTRQELYDRVWSSPAWKLGPELGLSGRGLAKLCAREGIPVPKRGYWAKKAAGWEPTKTKMPERLAAKKDTITFRPSHQARVAAEAPTPLPIVEVPDKLENPHPLVAATRRALRAARPDETGRLRAVETEGALVIHVSPESLDRALRIAQAVIAALDVTGAEFVLSDAGKHGPIVRIEGEEIPWEIEEQTQRHERQLTRAERLERERNPYRDRRQDYDVRPAGRLRLSLLAGNYSGLRRRWGDSEKHTLEPQLPRAVRGFLDLGAYLHQKTIESQEADRRRIEEEDRRERARRRQYIYEQRHKAVTKLVELSEEASRLRSFLVSTDERLRVSGSVADENTGRWLAWARRHLAWLDERAGQLPEFGDDAP